jgi:hypothetical protein
MEEDNTLVVWCGPRTVKNTKLFWALDTYDFRVFVMPADKNIDTIAYGVDDFIGNPPKGFTWEIKCVGDDKRCADICARIERILKDSVK